MVDVRLLVGQGLNYQRNFVCVGCAHQLVESQDAPIFVYACV